MALITPAFKASKTPSIQKACSHSRTAFKETLPRLHHRSQAQSRSIPTVMPTNAWTSKPPSLPTALLSKCMNIGSPLLDLRTSFLTILFSYDCNGSNAQKWLIVRGTTSVQVAGTNFCLDAGSAPANGVKMKIWQCFDGLAAQTWTYTNDNKIVLSVQSKYFSPRKYVHQLMPLSRSMPRLNGWLLDQLECCSNLAMFRQQQQPTLDYRLSSITAYFTV